MKKYLTKCLKSAYFMAFPIVMLGILSPLEIFSGNCSELYIGTKDFFWMFLGISFAVLIVAAMILGLFPEKLRKVLHSVIFGCSLMAYIQNAFLNKKLFKTDGSKIDWNIYRNHTIVTGIVWIVVIMLVILLPIMLKKCLEKVYLYGSVFFTIIQLVAAVSVLLTAPYSVNKGDIYVLSGDNQMSLAKENNIIVIILDRYGNITFENGLERDEDSAEIFSDFTYYNNANSEYNYTFPSIPYMFTHVKPDVTITTSEYKDKAWSEGISSEVHDTLAEAGYTFNFYSADGRAIYYNASTLQGSVDNITKVENASYVVNYDAELFLFFKTSLFKYAPYVVKPKLEVQSFYFDGIVTYEGINTPTESNGGYYELLTNEGLSIDTSMQNALVVTHLTGVHTPYEIDSYANKVDESSTDLASVQRGLNVILEEYFNQLKELGLYDSSTIIITADHGQYKDAYDPQPIFLMKLAGETHDEMITSTAPVTSSDLIPTILNVAGLEYSQYGESVLNLTEGQERERICCYPDNGWQIFTYYTNTGELIDKMKSDDYVKETATEDWD